MIRLLNSEIIKNKKQKRERVCVCICVCVSSVCVYEYGGRRITKTTSDG